MFRRLFNRRIVLSTFLGFAAALTTMLERLTSRNTATPPIPELPTEDSWADQVIKSCGWN